jgi:hypothetical protein
VVWAHHHLHATLSLTPLRAEQQRTRSSLSWEFRIGVSSQVLIGLVEWGDLPASAESRAAAMNAVLAATPNIKRGWILDRLPDGC